jgi:predicted transcriptional regulator
MHEVKLYKMLITIKEQKNLQSLLRLGMTYRQIADFAKQISGEGFVQLTDKGIVITEKGEKLLEDLAGVNKKTNKEEWIEPEEKARVEKISRDFIFLPRQSDPLF